QKRFLGDIAHELCSPIARMQMSLGVLQSRLRDDQKDALEDLQEEADHMASMVNELLSFSRASLGEKPLRLKSVKVSEIIDLALQRESGLHQDAEVHIELTGEPEVLADPRLLERSLANVIRNAFLYAKDAGPITIAVDFPDVEHTRILVMDEGDGVPEDALEHLFDPFYRPETARTRETGGTGLGLSIVKMGIESCQGTVSARNRKPRGFVVELVLKNGEFLSMDGNNA
ncbi:MAG: HAMP domain-containing sensor histidine kinase, partial [Verrucomicrobiota bacterium]